MRLRVKFFQFGNCYVLRRIAGTPQFVANFERAVTVLINVHHWAVMGDEIASARESRQGVKRNFNSLSYLIGQVETKDQFASHSGAWGEI